MSRYLGDEFWPLDDHRFYRCGACLAAIGVAVVLALGALLLLAGCSCCPPSMRPTPSCVETPRPGAGGLPLPGEKSCGGGMGVPCDGSGHACDKDAAAHNAGCYGGRCPK